MTQPKMLNTHSSLVMSFSVIAIYECLFSTFVRAIQKLNYGKYKKNRNMSSVQTKNRQFMCNICHLFFKEKRGLQRHYTTRKHTYKVLNIGSYDVNATAGSYVSVDVSAEVSTSLDTEICSVDDKISTFEDLMLFEPDDDTCFICNKHFNSTEELIRHVSNVDHLRV